MEGPLESDMLRSERLARIGGRLLIEIDFGTELVSFARLTEGKARKREDKRKGQRTTKGSKEMRASPSQWRSKVIKFHIGSTWRRTLGNRDDHATHQFPEMIASSCCSWPIGFGHITKHTHKNTRTKNTHNIYQPSPREYRSLLCIKISYSYAGTSSL